MLGLALRLGATPAHSNAPDQTIIRAVQYVRLCARACVSALTHIPDQARMITRADAVAPACMVATRRRLDANANARQELAACPGDERATRPARRETASSDE